MAETTSGLETDAVFRGEKKKTSQLQESDPFDPWPREGKEGEIHPILEQTGQHEECCAVRLKIKQM